MKIGTGIGIGAVVGCLALALVIAVDQNRIAYSEGFVHLFDKLAASSRGISDAGKWYTLRFKEEQDAKEKAEKLAREAKEAERLKSISDEPLLACFAAQNAVKERLSRAGTFPSCLEGQGVFPEKTPGDFIVRSYVSLPDASGIQRSHSYVVHVRHDPIAKTYATMIQQLD